MAETWTGKGTAVPEPSGLSPFVVALENMRDAVALYDADEHLVLANGHYRRLYGLTDELVRPGTPFEAIVAHCSSAGILKSEGASTSRESRARARTTGLPAIFHLELADGRTCEVHDQPLPGGGWVSTHADVTERLRIEARIAYLATHDTLTGLLDLPAFRAELGERLAESDYATRLAVARFALGGFRLISDTYGHTGSDAVITEIAERARLFGPDLTLARVGDDDFAALMPVYGTSEDAMIRFEGLRRALSKPHRIGRSDVTVAVALGCAISPEHGDSAATLLRRADTARRMADGGRSRLFDWELERERELSLTLAHDILPGIDRQEFELAYQPIVDIASGRLTGAEALLRWNHPTLGMVRPDRIVAVAEEFGQIAELGEWVLRRAAAAARRWPEALSVSVNVSGVQMRSRGFTRLVRSVLRDTGLDPRRLVLEVTESTVLADRGIRSLMDRVADLGVRFALDDFGTGFASLHYLLKYPFDRIKIDRSFVANLASRDDSQAIVEAVIGMASRLGKDVVVEGIEREGERRLLAEWGEVRGQGYLFGAPMTEAEFLTRVATGVGRPDRPARSTENEQLHPFG